MATPREELDALIALFEENIRLAFLGAIDDIVENALVKDIIAAINEGDIVKAFRALGLSDAALRPIIKAIEDAFERGGVFTAQSFPKYLKTPSGRTVFRFDVRNSRAEAWLRDKSGQLITRISDETMQNIRNIITEGLQKGRNPRNIALDIIGRIDAKTGKRVGGIVGLTRNQERWVANTRRMLENLDEKYFLRDLRDRRFDSIVRKAIASGKPLPQSTIDKLVTRYSDNALKYRGETIARTEALHSLNRSEWEAHKQAVAIGALKENAVRRHWDSAGDSRVRWSHKSMDRKYAKEGVGLDEPFVSPSGARMMHPGDTSLGASGDETIMCRCRVRLKVDWLNDLD
jgi:hypothetical protein